jgi:hypothetical protein
MQVMQEKRARTRTTYPGYAGFAAGWAGVRRPLRNLREDDSQESSENEAMARTNQTARRETMAPRNKVIAAGNILQL